MKPIFCNSLILAASLLSIKAWAVPTEVTVGNPSMQGAGCPQGTARATLSPDGSAISILFDNFSLEVGQRRVHPPEKLRKVCNFRIPVQVPHGFRAIASRIDYRGFASIPSGVKATLTTTDPSVNAIGKVVINKPEVSTIAPGEDVFLISHKARVSYKSANCKKTNILEFTTELKLTGLQMMQPNLVGDSLLALDTVDIGNDMDEDGAIRVAIQIVDCKD